MKKVKLKIKGMHCTSCAMTIDFDLEDAEGVKSAKTSYAREETEVVYDDKKVNIDTLVNLIKKTGYTCTVFENP